MAMRFADEDYARLYKRRTMTKIRLGFNGRAAFSELLTLVDRIGMLCLGGEDLFEAFIALACIRPDEEEAARDGLQRCLNEKCVLHLTEGDGYLFLPRFVEAQETSASNRRKQKAKRERKKAIADLEELKRKYPTIAATLKAQAEAAEDEEPATESGQEFSGRKSDTNGVGCDTNGVTSQPHSDAGPGMTRATPMVSGATPSGSAGQPESTPVTPTVSGATPMVSNATPDDTLRYATLRNATQRERESRARARTREGDSDDSTIRTDHPDNQFESDLEMPPQDFTIPDWLVEQSQSAGLSESELAQVLDEYRSNSDMGLATRASHARAFSKWVTKAMERAAKSRTKNERGVGSEASDQSRAAERGNSGTGKSKASRAGSTSDPGGRESRYAGRDHQAMLAAGRERLLRQRAAKREREAAAASRK